MDKQAKIALVAKIKQQEISIENSKKQIETRLETINEHKENTQEWLDMESAREQLQVAQKKLAAALSSDGEYNDLMEDLGQLRDKLKSEKQNLSDLIVGYALENKELQIEVNNKGDARELVITGKLGKQGKYQTNLFADKTA
jgi:predicted  nucleic acid-binding Zn-ribbon protein